MVVVQTMYIVAVVTDQGTYEVSRRYSEFRSLRDSLKRALPSETFHFPGKKRNPLTNNFGKRFLEVCIEPCLYACFSLNPNFPITSPPFSLKH